MGALQDFREQYPQYSDLTDDDLAERLYEKYYSDMDRGVYMERIGLAKPAEEHQPPTINSRLNDSILKRAKKADPLSLSIPMEKPTRPHRARTPMGGLTPLQLDAVEDWLAPDPTVEEVMDQVERMPKPRGRAPLSDQWFAGYDEYRSNRLLETGLEIADEAAARKAGRDYVSPKPIAGPLGVSADEMMRNQRARRDPEAYREALVVELQEVLDKRAARMERAKTVPFAPATERVLEAETIGEGLANLTDDPVMIIAELALRSGANVLEIIPLAAIGGLTAGPWGFALLGGKGGGEVEYRARVSQYLEEAGYDLTKADDLLRAAENTELMRQITRRAGIESGVIQAVDTATMGIATKALVPDAVKHQVARALINVTAQTGVQAFGGGAGEYLAGQASGHPSAPGEIIAEGVAEMGTAVIDVGAATIAGERARIFEAEVNRIVGDILETMDVPHETPTRETLPEPPGEPEPTPDTLPPPEPRSPEPADEVGQEARFERHGQTYVVKTIRVHDTGERFVNVKMPNGDLMHLTLGSDEATELAVDLAENAYRDAAQTERERLEAMDYEGLLDEMEKAIEKLREVHLDPEAAIDDRNMATADVSNLRRRLELEVQNQRDLEEQGVVDYIETHLAIYQQTLDELQAATTAQPGTPVDEGPAWFDVRMKRRVYRHGIQAMADELVVGGGSMGTLVRAEAYEGEFEETGERTGEVIDRTPSENPEWFQGLNANPDTKMTVRQVRKAVDKAARGDKLGVRELRVVTAMLDTITEERTEWENIDAAQEALEAAREARAQARAKAELEPDPDIDLSGEIFDEDEYDAEMTAESRIIFELMTQAEQYLTDDELEDIARRWGDDDAGIIAELERVIDEQERAASAAEVAPESEAETETGEAIEPVEPGYRRYTVELGPGQQVTADLRPDAEGMMGAHVELRGKFASTTGYRSAWLHDADSAAPIEEQLRQVAQEVYEENAKAPYARYSEPLDYSGGMQQRPKGTVKPAEIGLPEWASSLVHDVLLRHGWIRKQGTYGRNTYHLPDSKLDQGKVIKSGVQPLLKKNTLYADEAELAEALDTALGKMEAKRSGKPVPKKTKPKKLTPLQQYTLDEIEERGGWDVTFAEIDDLPGIDLGKTSTSGQEIRSYPNVNTIIQLEQKGYITIDNRAETVDRWRINTPRQELKPKDTGPPAPGTRITADQWEAFLATQPEETIPGVAAANKRLIESMRLVEAGRESMLDWSMVRLRGMREKLAAGKSRSKEGLIAAIWAAAKRQDDTVQNLGPQQMEKARQATVDREGQGDMFGANQTEQEIHDEIQRRDRARNTGQQELETGDPGDLFSQARQQTDIEDVEEGLERYLAEEPVETQAGGDGTESAKRAGTVAVRDIRSSGGVLSRSYSSELARNQRTSLVGKAVSDVRDLAVVAQIYRDPRFETLRYVFVDDDGNIVAQVGLTSRLPAAATAFIGHPPGFLNRLYTVANTHGATGFYLLHNHPSGQSKPSEADIRLTEYVQRWMPGFLGHVVINHNEWSEIRREVKAPDQFGENIEFNEYTHYQDLGAIEFRPSGGVAGSAVRNPADILKLAETIENPGDDPVVVVMNNRHVIRQVTTVPAEEVQGPRHKIRDALRRRALKHGGARLFVLGTNEELLKKFDNLVVDAILMDPSGAAYSMAARGAIEPNNPKDLLPQHREARVSPETSEAFDYLRYESVQERVVGFQTYRREEAMRAREESGEYRPPKPEGMSEAEYVEMYGERRVDFERRVNLSLMSTEELIAELYTDRLTGIANRRAFFEEHEDHAWLASIDVDSLKFINDTLSPDAGDAMLIAVGQALDQTGVDAYHLSGDEFYLGADSQQELEAALQLAKGILATQVLETENGRKEGIEFTYGIGTSKEIADAVQKGEKVRREAEGKRRGRDSKEPPPGFTMTTGMAAPVDFEPGTNYVPIIGRHGDLPLDANYNYVLGDGRRVRIPKEPLRRNHIISAMRRHFGRKIFQGRVKGKTRLGFYIPGIGAIRIKDANDIEVAAHEVAHWFDDRYPWIRTLYMQFKDEMKGVSYDADKVYEGFAEFMRLWFTQDYKAYQAAPGFYDAFMTALEGHPKQQAAMLEVQELMHAWHLQGARARGASKIGLGKEPILDRFRDAFERLPDFLLQRVFDGLRSFKVVERKVTGEVGDAAVSGYNSFRLAKGLHGIMLAIYHKGSIGWTDNGDIEFTGEGLEAIFGRAKGRMQELIEYMVGRRAEELRSQGRENLIRPDEQAAFLAHEQQHPDFPEIFQAWLDFNTRMLDFYQDSGLLSAATREAIDEMNKNYVPFNRVAETILGERVKRGGGSPFVRLTGGTQNINEIMDSIIGNTSHLVHMSLVNRGKQNFYRMILDQAGTITSGSGTTEAGNYAAPISKDAVPAKIHKEQIVKAVLEGMGLSWAWYRMASSGVVQSDEEMIVLDMIDRMLAGMDELTTFFQVGQDPKGAVDFYFEAGDKRFFEIIDPLLYESIAQLGPQAHNLAVSILGGFANLLRRGVVMTPTFQLKNFIRDTGNAFTLSKGKVIPVKDATVALLERIYNDEHYWLYMANGGGFASIAEAEGIESDRIIDTPAKILAMYDRGISAFEYANRIGEFKKLVERGWSMRDAALAGREISTDFAMHGSSDTVRVFTIAVPFLNARMQGIYRIAREVGEMRDNRLKFLGAQSFNYALRALITVTIPSLALFLLNKDDERYQEIPDWIRDLNWIVFTGEGEDDYAMIPKPFETGMLWGTIPERAMEYYYQRDEKELADAMLWMALQTFALDLTPQAFQPWMELSRNRKFTGAPIVPQYLQGLPPQEQWRFYTSDAMIALGRKLGISPMKAEHVVRGHFGTLGAWALGAADYVVGDISQGGERPEWDAWRENIIMDPFVNKGPLKRTKSEDVLYELLQETRQITGAVSLMYRRNPHYLEEFIANDAERQVLYELNTLLEDVATQVREINHAMDIVAGSTEISGAEKTRQLEVLQRSKNELTRQARLAINPMEVERIIQEAERDLERANQAATGG